MNEHKSARERATANEEERQVRELIATAGPRPTLPETDLAAIQAAAESTWQERYGESPVASKTRPWLLAAAVAAVAIGLGWWFMERSPVVDTTAVAIVEKLAGAATVREDDGPAQPLSPLLEIAAGSILSSAASSDGEDSFLTLRLVSGHSLRLDGGTRMRLLTTSLLDLEEGALYVDSGSSAGKQRVEVVTAFGTVTEIGTQFEVRLIERDEAALRVRVRDGRVRIAGGELTHTAGAGEELVLDLEGSVERRAVARYGSDWAWVLDSAPGLDIEGRTVIEVLDWVARETGWQVRFESEGLEKEVGAYEPFDSSAGEIRPEDAHQVFGGVGLDAELQDGVLLIRALETP